MRFLVAGALPHLGAALAGALDFRHHAVTAADVRGGAAHGHARAYLRERHPSIAIKTIVNIHDGRALGALLEGVDAILSVGDVYKSDLEFSLALADAASNERRMLPILRILAIAPDRGLEGERIVLRNGAARPRDLARGVPEERTAASLDGADLALRTLTFTRDQRIVFLRFAHLLAAGRFQFHESEFLHHYILQFSGIVDGAPRELEHPSSNGNVVDGEAAAIACERAFAEADRLSGSILHIGGGDDSILSIESLSEILQLLHGTRERREMETSRLLKSHLLDDAATRREVPGLVRTSARHAVRRFYQFALTHPECAGFARRDVVYS